MYPDINLSSVTIVLFVMTGEIELFIVLVHQLLYIFVIITEHTHTFP